MKIFFLLAISSILIISCESKTKTDGEKSRTDSTRAADSLTIMAKTIKKDSAHKIIKNYDKAKKTPIAWTTFDHGLLVIILSQPGVTSAKFFMGAYLNDSATPTDKKDAPVIILQVKRSGMVEDSQYFEGSNYCPPPYSPPCSID